LVDRKEKNSKGGSGDKVPQHVWAEPCLLHEEHPEEHPNDLAGKLSVTWQLTDDDDGAALGATVRKYLESPWARAKKLVLDGKVTIDGVVSALPGFRVRAGQKLAVGAVPSPKTERISGPKIVHLDSQLVVIDKPAGMLSVPHREADRDTALDLAAKAIEQSLRSSAHRAPPLKVVHRLDKDTSGLMVFARTTAAPEALKEQLRQYKVERIYLLLAHGRVEPGTIESYLVKNRGDGLRGATHDTKLGQLAITHVKVLEHLDGVSLCTATLETGRTNQLRIHLSERGHPLLGDRVYLKPHVERGLVPIDAPRLMLHAATLGFMHPSSGRPFRFESKWPEELEAIVASRRLPKI